MAAHDEFTAFAEAHTDRLRTFAFTLCRDWHLAQDLIQITLIKMFLSWRGPKRIDNPWAYAQKVLFRSYFDHLRRRSSQEIVEDVPGEPTFELNPELRLVIVDLLSQLPARDRAIVILRYFADLSVRQVADALEVPVGVVRSQTRRSLIKLGEMLGPYGQTLLAG